MRWTFRDATTADVPTLTALINRAYRVEDFFKLTDRIDEADLARHLERGRIIAARGNGQEPAGCVYVEVRNGQGYLGLLSAEPDLQGQGLGRALIGAAEAAAMAAGCEEMTLSVVNLREELIPWYGRIGYAAFATEPFPEDEPTRVPVHFILMSRPLRTATPSPNQEASS